MRPRARRPINRRYFHKKPKIDKRDMAILKKKIGDLNLKAACFNNIGINYQMQNKLPVALKFYEDANIK